LAGDQEKGEGDDGKQSIGVVKHTHLTNSLLLLVADPIGRDALMLL
jgi:hypothetical protein